jgi:hypothetical protein
MSGKNFSTLFFNARKKFFQTTPFSKQVVNGCHGVFTTTEKQWNILIAAKFSFSTDF